MTQSYTIMRTHGVHKYTSMCLYYVHTNKCFILFRVHLYFIMPYHWIKKALLPADAPASSARATAALAAAPPSCAASAARSQAASGGVPGGTASRPAIHAAGGGSPGWPPLGVPGEASQGIAWAVPSASAATRSGCRHRHAAGVHTCAQACAHPVLKVTNLAQGRSQAANAQALSRAPRHCSRRQRRVARASQEHKCTAWAMHRGTVSGTYMRAKVVHLCKCG